MNVRGGVGRWRPQCYVCGRFVAIEAYDVIYDWYAGAWEEGYTQCAKHGGPSPERVLEIRAARQTQEWQWQSMLQGVA